jgi:hypothetical protein
VPIELLLAASQLLFRPSVTHCPLKSDGQHFSRGAPHTYDEYYFSCLLAAGCSPSLLPMPSERASEDVGAGLVRIAVPTSSLTDCASADECVLVKAGEATQRVGGTHFMVLPGHGGPTQRGYDIHRRSGEVYRANTTDAEEALTFLRKRPNSDGRDA